MIISMSARRICLDTGTEKLLIYDHTDACVVAQLTLSQMKSLVDELVDYIAGVEEKKEQYDKALDRYAESIHEKQQREYHEATLDFVTKKIFSK